MRLLSHCIYIFPTTRCSPNLSNMYVYWIYKENPISILFDFPLVFAGCCQSHQRRALEAHQNALSKSFLGLSPSLSISASCHNMNTIAFSLTTLGCHVAALMAVKSVDKHLANDFHTMEQIPLQTKLYTDGTCTYDNAIKAVRKYCKCIIRVSGACSVPQVPIPRGGRYHQCTLSFALTFLY